MKTIEQVLTALGKWMEGNWQRAVLDPAADWPRKIKLSAQSGAALEADFSAALDWTYAWQDWADSHRVELKTATRRVSGTSQHLPVYLIIPDPDAAARVLGGKWPHLLQTARDRTDIIAACFPDADPAPILGEIINLSSVDFDLLLTAAEWFRTHDATGMTPRQVPIEGLDSKWLDTGKHLVRHLSDRETLGLVQRPRTIHYTYLDPEHLRNGGRRYDSLTLGDTAVPAYRPDIVIITENKDTTLFFPHLDHGIAIQGDGDRGPARIPHLPWVPRCPTVVYWGDLDADGFEIINDYRKRGLDVRTILMDAAALHQYARYGIREDRHGKTLLRPRRNLPLLTPTEQTAYEELTDPASSGPYRIEQERIPLDTAHNLLIRKF